MQTLYLIRHTTPRIEAGICYGQLDIDVADSFEKEAQDVLHWLPPVELILSSPLLRAQRLAACLALERHCELRTDSRLMEKDFGEWEGKPWADIPRGEVDAWAADILNHAPTGGESAQQLMQRTRNFLHDVAQLPQQNLAVVAHGGSIRAILALIGGVPLENTLEWKIEYGAVAGVRLT